MVEKKMSYSEDENILRQVLTAIVNSTAGLKHAIIIDDTGITILSQSKFTFAPDNEISVEKIGAIGGAVYTAGEEQGQILGYGNMNLQITEYNNGMIYSVRAGKGVLVVATDPNVQIGFIRATLKKWAPKIAQILNKHILKGAPETISDDLKELYSSDTSNSI
jgi:predicted regulator of Ras-like GTPase activity (Roadblock/LC7/MglB family)